MAQLVEVPNYGVVEFPDGMSDDQISAAIKKTLDQDKAAATKDTSATSAVKYGAANAAAGMEKLWGWITGKKPEDQRTREGLLGTKPYQVPASDLVPQNYDPASRQDLWKNPSYIPRALLESAAPALADVAGGVAGGMVGGLPGFMAGSAMTHTAMSAAPAAEELAANRAKNEYGPPMPGAPAQSEPSLYDKALGTGIAMGEGALSSLVPLGAAGKLAGAPLRSVGTKGAIEALAHMVGNAGVAGAANVGSQALHDAAVGNYQDPTRLSNAGVLGLATGAVVGGPKATRDIFAAQKFSAPRELIPHMTEVANAIKETGEPISSKWSGGKAGGAAIKEVGENISSEINSIYQNNPELKAAIDKDGVIKASLDRAASQTDKATARDASRIADAVSGLHNSDALLDAVNRSRALDVLKGVGTNYNGAFRGGISAPLENFVAKRAGPLALGAGIGAAGGYAPFMFSPTVGGVLGGITAGAKLADFMTGNRLPVRQFANKFADGGPTRLMPQAPLQPEVPLPPTPPFQPPSNATGPKLPPIQPWSAPPAAPSPEAPIDFKSIRDFVSGMEKVNKIKAANTPAPAPEPDMPSVLRQSSALVRGLNRVQAIKDRAAKVDVETPTQPSAPVNVAAPIVAPPETKAPAPVVAPKPVAPQPAPVAAAPHDLDIPDFLRRTAPVQSQTALASVAKSPTAPAPLRPNGQHIEDKAAPKVQTAKAPEAPPLKDAGTQNRTGSGVDDTAPPMAKAMQNAGKAALDRSGSHIDDPTPPKADKNAAILKQAFALDEDELGLEKSGYGHLSPEEAAGQIGAQKEAAGKIKLDRGKLETATLGYIIARDKIADKLASSLNRSQSEMRDIMRATSSPTQGVVVAYRLKQRYPDKAAAIDAAFKGQKSKAWYRPRSR